MQLPGSTDQAASFEFLDEGHTLGNALRYIIMKKQAHHLTRREYATNLTPCLAPMSSSAHMRSPILQKQR